MICKFQGPPSRSDRARCDRGTGPAKLVFLKLSDPQQEAPQQRQQPISLKASAFSSSLPLLRNPSLKLGDTKSCCYSGLSSASMSPGTQGSSVLCPFPDTCKVTLVESETHLRLYPHLKDGGSESSRF